MKSARLLVLLGSTVMFLGGLAHGLGYLKLFPTVAASNLAPELVGALRCVWLVFSAHSLLLAPALVWISRRPGSRSLLRYLALIPLVDAVLMFHFVGLFAGFYIVCTSTALLLAGAWTMPLEQAA
jgi:hypothetical protein